MPVCHLLPAWSIWTGPNGFPLPADGQTSIWFCTLLVWSDCSLHIKYASSWLIGQLPAVAVSTSWIQGSFSPACPPPGLWSNQSNKPYNTVGNQQFFRILWIFCMQVSSQSTLHSNQLFTCLSCGKGWHDLSSNGYCWLPAQVCTMALVPILWQQSISPVVLFKSVLSIQHSADYSGFTYGTDSRLVWPQLQPPMEYWTIW